MAKSNISMVHLYFLFAFLLTTRNFLNLRANFQNVNTFFLFTSPQPALIWLIGWPTYNLDHSVLCENIGEWLLFRVYNPVVSSLYYDVVREAH